LHRTFLAIDFSESFTQRIIEYLGSVTPRFTGRRLSWVDPRIFHLTLHFFGDVDDRGVDALREKFRAVAAAVAAPRIEIAGLTYLPSAHSPRVLCLNLAVEPKDALAPLLAEAKALAASLRVMNEDRTWRAHLTLARVREDKVPPVATLPLPPRYAYSPGSFELKESFLSPQGPRYATIESFPFSGIRAGLFLS